MKVLCDLPRQTLFLVVLLHMFGVSEAQTTRTTTKWASRDLSAEVIESKTPVYPYVARRNRWDGVGQFRLRIDFDSGKVIAVEVVKSTTHKILDDAAIDSLQEWKFKPRTAHEAIVPVAFTLEGKKLSEARRLATYAPEPQASMTYHTGTGVFRFIVDYETGKVIDVKIIESTGRVSFDEAVLKAYRQWQFLPHKVHSIDTTVGFSN